NAVKQDACNHGFAPADPITEPTTQNAAGRPAGQRNGDQRAEIGRELRQRLRRQNVMQRGSGGDQKDESVIAVRNPEDRRKNQDIPRAPIQRLLRFLTHSSPQEPSWERCFLAIAACGKAVTASFFSRTETNMLLM